MRALVLSFVVAFVMCSSMASAHLTGYPNSVDSSTSPAQIRYSTNSKYTAAVNNAVDRWNAESRVEIKPDAWNTVKDLEISDTNSSENLAGKFIWNPGADNIWLNTRYLDASDWEYEHRAKTALHEVGHSLDFDHNDLDWPTSIMKTGKRFQDYLGSHDKSDDDSRWN